MPNTIICRGKHGLPFFSDDIVSKNAGERPSHDQDQDALGFPQASSLVGKMTDRGQWQGDAEKEGRDSGESTRIRHFMDTGKSIEMPVEFAKKVTAER